jgi:hypothetical protein
VKRPPTDFELLRAIRDRHYDDYLEGRVEGRAGRHTDIFVPVDIPAVAAELGTQAHSVFGRLYYHLEELYGQEPDTQGERKAFFTPRLGPDPQDRDCVNFPLLEAVLAGLWEQRDRDRRTFWTSAISLGIAITSLVVSVLVATGQLG